MRGASRTVAGVLAMIVTGCASSSLGIRLESASGTATQRVPLIVDARRSSDRYRRVDPENASSYRIYLADNDTYPRRLDFLRDRLANVPQIAASAKPVTVHALDILWDTSGTPKHFVRGTGERGMELLGRMPSEDGTHDFTCTLVATMGDVEVRKVFVAGYVAREQATAASPETGKAAERCLSEVIDAWVAESAQRHAYR